MQKLVVAVVATSVVAGAFLAGVAVGKVPPPQPKFIAAEEVKWDDVDGLKLGQLVGDYKKGAYGALLRIPAGYTSQLHAHTGAYEAVEISGTSSHWMRGEDGTKAKKMTPGSYWTIPGKTEHVSSCAKGSTDCVMYVWQKVKFDALPAKDVAPVAGSAAMAAPAAGSGSAVKPLAGTGSAAKPATGSGSSKPAAASVPVGTGSGSASAPKK